MGWAFSTWLAQWNAHVEEMRNHPRDLVVVYHGYFVNSNLAHKKTGYDSKLSFTQKMWLKSPVSELHPGNLTAGNTSHGGGWKMSFLSKGGDFQVQKPFVFMRWSRISHGKTRENFNDPQVIRVPFASAIARCWFVRCGWSTYRTPKPTPLRNSSWIRPF